MKRSIDLADDESHAEPSAIKVVILYEDRETGLRAKGFADRLAEAHGCSECRTDSIWRSELLEFPSIADEAGRAAADCDFIIVSLRGDGAVPFAMRSWFDTGLAGASANGTALVALFDPLRGDRRAVEAARHYFHSVCAEYSTPFFSCTTALKPLPARALDRQDEPGSPRQPRRRTRSHAAERTAA